MNVDVQSHVFPREYAELYVDAPGFVSAERLSRGQYLLHYGNVQQFRLNLEDYAPERKLADMDQSGIDVSVLSVNIPSPSRLPPDTRIQGARLCNDFLADLCRNSQGRFVAIASLPLPDVTVSIQELDRAIEVLDLRGVFCCSHLDGTHLDDPILEPFYARVAALDVPLVLHPTVPTWGEHVQDHAMIPMAAFMMDTSLAMLRLILGGVMETASHPQDRASPCRRRAALFDGTCRGTDRKQGPRTRSYHTASGSLLRTGIPGFGDTFRRSDSLRSAVCRARASDVWQRSSMGAH